MSTAGEMGVEWETLVQMLDAALRSAVPDSDWLAQVLQVHARVRSLGTQHLDEALFHFVSRGGQQAHDYSTCHAVHCMLAVGAVARTLGWDAELVEVVEKAALTMNVAMRRLQDRLALQPVAGVDQDSREHIARHPVKSARLLEDSGVHTPVWLEAVRLHHDSSLDARPLEQLTPGQRLALLLRRVDVYSAVLSRRATRLPLTPMQAARRACLGADGRPDVIGAALLKTVGLYPPGSFVQLANRERGVVLGRGLRADQPMVAVLTNVRGEPLPEPRLRDTAHPGYAVRAGLQPDRAPVDLTVALRPALQRAAMQGAARRRRAADEPQERPVT
jgi:hypothetical protein